MNQARERPSLLPDSCTIEFAGLPDSFESEGYDRTHMRLPDCQNRLIEEILSVQSEVIVVLHNGSPVEMPWLPKVKGLLEAYLGGQAVGRLLQIFYSAKSIHPENWRKHYPVSSPTIPPT